MPATPSTTTTTTDSTPTTAASPAAPAVSEPHPPPPPSTIPDVPATFVAPAASEFAGYRPITTELAAAADAAAELVSFPDYAQAFGKNAPDPSKVAASLTQASGWAQIATRAAAYASYAKAMSEIAWKTAFSQTDALKPFYAATLLRDPTLPTQYPDLDRFMTAASAGARKAVATKKKILKGEPVRSKAAQRTAAKKAAAKAAAPAAPATTPAQPTTPATNVTVLRPVTTS